MRSLASSRVGLVAITALCWAGALACSGGDFTVAPASVGDSGGADGGVDATSDGSVGADAADVGSADSDATPPADGGCAAFNAVAASDVYVDSASSLPSLGSKACPFHTIREGTALGTLPSGVRTVHVAGGVPQRHYPESDFVHVGTRVTLLGDGPAKTRILASGTCNAAGAQCAVFVDAEGVVDGFAIGASGANTNVYLAIVGAAGKGTIRNTELIAGALDGVIVYGSADLGPGIVASKNTGSGVTMAGTGTLHVIQDVTAPNLFDGNGASGINVVNSGALAFDGGSASNNTFNGIRVSSATIAATPHAISNLVAKGNPSCGVCMYDGSSLVLRKSTLLGDGVGLSFKYGDANTLDVGSTGVLGGNVFGASSATVRNVRAGVFLCNSRGFMTQPAEGDTWSSCLETETAIAACDTPIATYSDVVFAPKAGSPGQPIVTTMAGCITAL